MVSAAMAFAAVFVTLYARAQPSIASGSIHGHVVVLLRGDDQPNAQRRQRRIEIPDAQVVATNVATGIASPAFATNAHGYYQIKNLPPGNYRVCGSKANFNSDCLSKDVTVTNFNVVMQEDVRLVAKPPFIVGRVTLADQRQTPCFMDRPAFGTLLSAKVTLEDANQKPVTGAVNGNGIGEYVLPEVSVPPGSYQVTAQCQNAKAGAAYAPGPAEAVRNIVIANKPPRVLRIETTVANKAVRIAAPGATATLRAIAQDPDGQALRFKWVDSNGVALGGPASSIQMKLPGKPSSVGVFVEANDGLGGYAYSMVPVTGAPPPTTALFTGMVVNADTKVPIPNARVAVNGTAGTTDGKGAFTIIVPTGVRYNIAARKDGFALYSKVTYAPAAELHLVLQPVVPVAIDLGKGGTFTSRQTDKRNLPVILTVPPNSLVDGKGKVATGMGRAYIWGYPAGTPIPGDMTADIKAKPRLETYGAVDIVLTDASGQPLQVKPGAKIGLTITPAAPNAPPTMPFFVFDEGRGIWRQLGNLALAGNQYKASISHLTAFNADLAFGTTGCIEYHVDLENSPALPFYLHLEQNGQTANHEPFQVSDFGGVVSRLRPNEATDWWALPAPTSAKADALGHGTVQSSNFTSNPNDPDGDFPPVGSGKCTLLTLNADFPAHETYLTGLPVGIASQAAYSSAVDTWAGTPRSTLTDFKNLNGFPNSDEGTAVYFNDGDLKLGRDMHCRAPSGGRIACYVSNYLNTAAPPAGAAPALIAAGGAHSGTSTAAPFATVAMEWDPSKVGTEVQFYVYDGSGARQTQATLDSEGAKPVPQICLACHGGGYNNTDNLVHGARFLPFDLPSFRMADDEFNATAVTALGLDNFTRLNQLGAFRKLNDLVKQTSAGQPAGDAIIDLIDGWYQGCGGVSNGACGTCVGGAPACPGSFNRDYRPSGWQTTTAEHDLYDKVVRVTCRGCHAAQPSYRDWDKSSEFTGNGSVDPYVCSGSQRRMPHAEVPFKRFWQNNLGTLMEQAPESLAACNP
jgi:hypothetical protein